MRTCARQGDDECDDMQTMTGQESLGASTRGQFSFDPEPRKQADKFSNWNIPPQNDPNWNTEIRRRDQIGIWGTNMEYLGVEGPKWNITQFFL